MDAYTRRILDRHGILPANAPYEEIKRLFETALPKIAQTSSAAEARYATSATRGDCRGAAHRPSPMSLAKRSALAQVYNEMHALLVGVGKNYCARSKPKCDECPLQPFLPKLQ